MEIKNIKSLIARSLRQELSPDELQQLHAWINENDDNKKLYASIRDIDTLSHIAQLAPPNINTTRRLMYRKFARIAAIALLLIVPAFTLLIMRNDKQSVLTDQANNDVLFISDGATYNLSNQSGQEQLKADLPTVSVDEDMLNTSTHHSDKIKMNCIVVPKGKTFNVILCDGTQVTLNSMSELRFPSDFPDNERLVELKGEAFFDVAEETARKFIVKMGDNRIRVLGTKFNASFYENQPASVSLVQGRVEALTSREALEIKPGEQAVFPQAGNAITVATFNPDEVLGWKNGFFFFEDRPLWQITQALEQWYDIRFEFSDELLKDIQLYLRIQKSRSLDDLLKALEATRKVTFSHTGKVVRIESFENQTSAK